MFKKIIITLAVIFLFSGQMVKAETYEEEKIRQYDIKIKINKDATFDVEEKIVYDFDITEDRHGIYRNIPVDYGQSFTDPKIYITNIKVSDENGEPYNFVQSRDGNNLNIKIGEAGVIVAGIKTYVISYNVKNALTFFETFDELYWNVIGTDWSVPIYNPMIEVILPEMIPIDGVKISCYTGSYGENGSCLYRFDEAEDNQVKKIVFNDPKLLEPYNGLTFAISWPKNFVAYPTQEEKMLRLFSIYGYLVIPMIAFVVMFRLWWKRGRDPKGRGVGVAEFEAPKNFTPATVGSLIQEDCVLKDISAEIIELAVLGYLKIKRVEKDKLIGKSETFEIRAVNKDRSGLKNYQVKILDGLFESGDVRRLDQKDTKFYQALTEAKSDIMKSLVSDGYIKKNPMTVKVIYMIIAAVFIFAFIPLAMYVGVVGVLSMAATGIIIGSIGYFMPAKTLNGVYAKEHILGLKKYLEVAEKDRLEFHNAPEKSLEIFEKLLPFAIA